MYSNNAVLFSFGVGGHYSQANRLARVLLDDLKEFDIVTISDLKEKPLWSDRHYVCGELREKDSHFQVFTNLGPFLILKKNLTIKKENN
ncbi:polysaccharide biosynthesis protein, partial [Vibrio sp. 10N.222.55.C6]